MNCAHCGKPIEPAQLVELNGFAYHVQDCFAAGLRAKTFKPEELSVMFDQAVPPLAARRRSKKRSAI